ncbi:MAG: 30S ribosomal protein S3, partial [Candidatus Limnocylindrus sp.]
PLHTLRADIDLAVNHAPTTFGQIGVKVWIYRGDAPADVLKPKAISENTGTGA